jgi:hypothetical protein
MMLPPEDFRAWSAALAALRGDPARRERLAQRAAESSRQHSWLARARRALEGLEGSVRGR